MTSPRDAVKNIIAPHVPKAWKIVTSERSVDLTKSITVQIKQRQLIRTPAAPNGAHDIDFVLTITSPHEDVARAEDQLDGAVNVLVFALDDAGIKWDEAKKVENEARLAYDITLTLTTQKDKS